MARAAELLTPNSDACAVGRIKPIEELPLVKRWVARYIARPLFKWLRLGAGSVELQGIATSQELAEAWCEGRGNWFFTPLPVNRLLPEGTCDYKGHFFPASEAADLYAEMRYPLQAMRASPHQYVMLTKAKEHLDKAIQSAR